MGSEELAIRGGSPAVTVETSEGWEPDIEGEKDAVCRLIESRELSGAGSGLPARFEEEFREFVGADYCLTVDHGSSALQSAYFAVGVGPGDEVIVPAAGYLGSYSGALHLGARPVFCETDGETLLIDPADAERRITERTRAICAIHMSGRVCDMDALLEIGRKHGIAIVEDAAHAHGASWDGKRVGSFGDIACFSLQGSVPGGKPVSGGEGGIATTGNRHYYERMLIYCHLHRGGVLDELTEPAHQALDSEVLGLKWRAHPLALAIAEVALHSLEERIEKARANRDYLFARIRELPGLKPPREYPKSSAVPGLYGGLQLIYTPSELGGLSAEKFVAAAKAEGVPIGGPGLYHMEHLRRIFTEGFDFYGEGRGPLCGDFKPYGEGDFPISEDLNRRVLTMPSFIEPPDGLLEQIIEGLRKVTDNCRSLA